jgi:hypothetical protein
VSLPRTGGSRGTESRTAPRCRPRCHLDVIQHRPRATNGDQERPTAQWRSCSSEQLQPTATNSNQERERSHNPKVGGSNPPPATQKSAETSRSDGPALLLPAEMAYAVTATVGSVVSTVAVSLHVIVSPAVRDCRGCRRSRRSWSQPAGDASRVPVWPGRCGSSAAAGSRQAPRRL